MLHIFRRVGDEGESSGFNGNDLGAACSTARDARSKDGGPDHVKLHQNDLSFSTDYDGRVEWDRVLSSSDLAKFLELKDSGSFQCTTCGYDVSATESNYGCAVPKA